jgi:hypothetical protein
MAIKQTAMSKREFSTIEDEKLAKQLCEGREAQWKDWQMELLVLANNENWEELKDLIRRGPATAAPTARNCDRLT